MDKFIYRLKHDKDYYDLQSDTEYLKRASRQPTRYILYINE